MAPPDFDPTATKETGRRRGTQIRAVRCKSNGRKRSPTPEPLSAVSWLDQIKRPEPDLSSSPMNSAILVLSFEIWTEDFGDLFEVSNELQNS